jgi:adenosine deaminase
MAPISHEVVQRFPKVELHVHLEACVSSDTIAALAAKLDVAMPRPIESLFHYDSLQSFLDSLEWWTALFRTPVIAEDIAYRAAAQFKADGIVYAEVLTSPVYWSHLEYQEFIPAVCAGFDRAHADGHADCRLLPSIHREQSADWALELVNWIGNSRLDRIVGIGLDGNEVQIGRTSAKFEETYALAASVGLGRTVHSGESSGPEGVRDVLDYLKVDRIDHGVRAIEDRELLGRLVREQVTLNVCPTSNILTGLYPSLQDHPIGRLMEAGVRVTVNSDDPLAMNVSLSGELFDTGVSLGWALADVAAATRRAVDASFLDKAARQELYEVIENAEVVA